MARGRQSDGRFGLSIWVTAAEYQAVVHAAKGERVNLSAYIRRCINGALLESGVEGPLLIERRETGRRRRFSDAQVRQMRVWQAEGWSVRKIAKHFGCGPAVTHKWLTRTEVLAMRDTHGDGNQHPSGLRGDPGAPRTVNGETRDQESSHSSDSTGLPLGDPPGHQNNDEDVYRFCVDDRPHESRHTLLTAMEIKSIAGVPYNHNLLCRLQKLRDDEPIEVAGKEFYSTPRAYWSGPEPAVPAGDPPGGAWHAKAIDFRPWAKHDSTCPREAAQYYFGRIAGTCSCGLDQALADAGDPAAPVHEKKTQQVSLCLCGVVTGGSMSVNPKCPQHGRGDPPGGACEIEADAEAWFCTTHYCRVEAVRPIQCAIAIQALQAAPVPDAK